VELFVVVGSGREGVDPFLADLVPVADPELLPGAAVDSFDTADREHRFSLSPRSTIRRTNIEAVWRLPQ